LGVSAGGSQVVSTGGGPHKPWTTPSNIGHTCRRANTNVTDEDDMPWGVTLNEGDMSQRVTLDEENILLGALFAPAPVPYPVA
jgi:hypothetical protein